MAALSTFDISNDHSIPPVNCTHGVKSLNYLVISSFADQATADIYDGLETRWARRIPQSIWKVARRKLDMIEAAHTLDDLRVPRGNRLEALKGRLTGLHSIRINEQYRIVFRWVDGIAKEVLITDYH